MRTACWIVALAALAASGPAHAAGGGAKKDGDDAGEAKGASDAAAAGGDDGDEDDTAKKKDEDAEKKDADKKDTAKPDDDAKHKLPVSEAEPAVSGLPDLRILPSVVKLDVRASGNFRGWTTSPFPTVDLQTTTYVTWQLELRASLFDFVKIHRISYESSSFTAPTASGSSYASAGSAVNDVAWLLGMLGVPLSRWPDKEGYFRDSELFARYEARVFESTVSPSKAIRFVPYDTDAARIERIKGSRKDITLSTSLESIAAGAVISERGFDPGLMPTRDILEAYFQSLGAYVGVMGMRYAKPYMVHLGESYDSSYLYDAEFDALGGMFGLWSGPRDKWPYFQAMVASGAGSVSLTHDLDITQKLPVSGTVATVQVSAKGGIRYPIYTRAPRITLGLAGTFDGAWFFLQDSGDDKKICNPSCPSLNSDMFWSGQGELQISL